MTDYLDIYSPCVITKLFFESTKAKILEMKENDYIEIIKARWEDQKYYSSIIHIFYFQTHLMVMHQFLKKLMPYMMLIYWQQK